MQHQEQRIAVAFELRALVGAAGVLDGQLVQAEFLLDFVQQGRVRLAQAQPDKRIFPRHGIADFLDANLPRMPPAGVGDTFHDHGVVSPATAIDSVESRLGRARRGVRFSGF